MATRAPSFKNSRAVSSQIPVVPSAIKARLFLNRSVSPPPPRPRPLVESRGRLPIEGGSMLSSATAID